MKRVAILLRDKFDFARFPRKLPRFMGGCFVRFGRKSSNFFCSLRPLQFAIGIGVLIFFGSIHFCSAQMRTLRGHVPEIVKRLPPLNRLDGKKKLNLAIGLPLQNEDALAELLQQIYDPASTNFHHYLTPEQFAENFGPTESDYARVIQFVETNGLTVTETYSNRLLVDVSGAVSDLEKAFHVKMQVFQHPAENRTFFSPDVEPTVNANIPISDVSGLNNYILPRPLLKIKSLNQSSTISPAVGSGPGGAYMGNDFRAAYVPGTLLDGFGQSVGLLEFDGYYAGDISAYENEAGLPNVPLQNVLLDGFNGIPTIGSESGNVEVALDIEMIISMAPGLSNIIVFEAGNTGIPNDILNSMVAQTQIKQFSSSWSWSGGPRTTTDNIFEQMAAQGQSYFQASGDGDAYDATIDQTTNAFTPSDSPYVTSVGGTTLTTDSAGGSWLAEAVWNWGLYQGSYVGSSGGVSTHYSIPAWQANVDMTANQGSTQFRNIPDVAMIADNIFIEADNGRQEFVGGTSAAAPLWAAFIALANQQAVANKRATAGFLNPAIYAIGTGTNYSSDFHDVIIGNNTNTISPIKFFAASGYDLCTGWGTPTGQHLINDLAGPPDPFGISPSKGFAASGQIGGPFTVVSENFQLTNLGTAPLSWTLVNTSLWLNISGDSGTLAARENANVTCSLNAVASGLAAGTYAANVSFTNLTTGIPQNRQFTLQIGQSLIQNGGFETGVFSGWTLNGDTTPYNLVAANFFVRRGRTNENPATEVFVHSGSYGAELGEPNTLAYLSQTLSTFPGQTYLISFWLANPFDGDTPNEFSVSWNGTMLSDQNNLREFDWTNMRFIVTATDSNSVLQFGARNDPEAFGLDDVSVTPVSIPQLHPLPQANNDFQFTWNATTGLVYQIQSTTNLAEPDWTDFGNPITASNGVVQLSDTNAFISASQKFYRIIVSP